MKLPLLACALGFVAGVSAFAQDSTPPQLVSTASIQGTTVGVKFNEAVDPATAGDPSKYSLGGNGTVDSATVLADNVTVLLGVTGLSGNSYTLNVNGVTDLNGNALTGSIGGQAMNITSQDLGFVEAPAIVAPIAPGAFDVYARGHDIWGVSDSGHFAFEERTGDFDVRVRLESFTAPAISANAGLMARESVYEGSRNIQVVTYSNQRLFVSAQRVDTDGTSSVFPGNWNVDWPANAAYPNIWLRLKRVGNTFTTYGSTNGDNWVQVGQSVTPAIPYPDTILVGFRTTPVEVQVPGSLAVAKYREYGDFAISTGSINITKQPANTQGFETKTATFDVGIEVTGTAASNASYQWQRDGVDIANATGSTYTTPILTAEDNGAKYRVRITLPGGLITQLSNEATLTVVNDQVPPSIVSTASLDGTTVGVCFNEAVAPATAGDISKYSLGGGVTINNATLEEDGMTVTLAVAGLSGSTFNLTVNGVTDLAGNAVTATVAGELLGFTAGDLGLVDAPGRAVSCAPGSVDVWARGWDIWGFADSGHFVWKEHTGDFDVRVRLESFVAPAPDANAGLMAREDLSPGSRNIGVVSYANLRNWTAVQRVDPDGNSSVLPGNWRINWPESVGYPNVWLRLKRTGNTFTTYGSADGEAWTQIGDSVTPEVPYPDTILLGLRSTPVEVEVAGSTAVVRYRDYGAFSVQNASINITSQPSNQTVLENTAAEFAVSAEAVGTPSSNLTYQWLRNGEEIAGATSPTYSIPSTVSADNNAKFRVRISLPGGISVLSQEVTLTVTEDLIAPTIMGVSSLDGVTVGVCFNEPLDPSTATDPSRYTINGATVQGAFLWEDGVTVSLSVSGLTGNAFTLNVNGVGDVEGNPVNASASGVVQGLTVSDLGFVEEPGRAVSCAPGSVDIWTRGWDIWGLADSGQFIWEERTGDFDVSVRLESFEAPAISANAGLMARESLEAGSRNVQVVTYSNQRLWVSALRAELDGVSSVFPGDWDVAWPEGADYPNIWLRLKRVGNTFTTYGSVDGQTWVQVGDALTPTVPYPETVLVGMRTTPVEVQVAGSSAVASYRDYGDFVLAVNPRLLISENNDQITISWPAAGTDGFVLESSTTLLANSWTTVAAAPVNQGNQKSVSLPLENGHRFFRLRN